MLKMTTVEARMSLLKGMNDYILELGDEDIWETWILMGVPDCPSEEVFFTIAADDELWLDTVKIFATLTAEEEG